jgi:hypothetical protein
MDECVSPAHPEAAEDTERDSLTFLPPTQQRGDIARSIFYMDLRYDGNEVDTFDLVVSDCPESTPNGAGMGYLSQLIQWHEDDPVDLQEMQRNENVCMNWQGNRNPFVDFPELVVAYFGRARPLVNDGAGYDCSTASLSTSLPTSVETAKPTSYSTNPPFVTNPTNQPIDSSVNSIIITGVIDGPLRGGLPKAIELYAFSDVPDLSLYGVGFANNGNGSPGVEFRFPSGSSTTAGSYITISYEHDQYTAYFFGSPPDYITGYASINGNDAVELFFHGIVVDVFGDVDMDGTGADWEYMDGWAYRRSGSLPGTTFMHTDWIFSGINAIDSCSLNVNCQKSFPYMTYQSAVAKVTSTGMSLASFATRRFPLFSLL